MIDMMARIDVVTEDRIKSAARILDIVSHFVDVKKEGVNYVGLCPFHDDHSVGSFVISPSKNVCSCYSCGKTGMGPIDFLMEYGTGMDYPTALRWIASKYNIPIRDEDPMKVGNKCVERKLEDVKLPMLTLPIEMVNARMRTEGNVLVDYLRSLPLQDHQRRNLETVLKLYAVGTSVNGWTNGWTIWWQIDDKFRVRSGKMMRYDANGHRHKEQPGEDGKIYPSTTWVHTQLKKAGKVDMDKCCFESCLFGLHLVDALPDAEVCIVESEKTAIIASCFTDPKEKLYMACGSKTNITMRMLKPLMDRKRKIVLYPDVDGVEEWEEQRKKLNYKNVKVTKNLRKLWKPCDGVKADLADILLRMVMDTVEPENTTSEKVHEFFNIKFKNEGVELLCKKLDLHLNNGK